MPTADNAVPDAGEVVWIDFGLPGGREQRGRRPALVLTPRIYNASSSVMLVCPITRNPNEWPFKVPLPPFGLLTGFVLVDQVRAVDPTVRAFKSVGRVPQETLAEVRAKLAALLGI